MRAFTFALLVAVLGTSLTPEASAQVPQDPVLTASRLLVRGMTRSFLGDYDGALALFDQALRLQPDDAAIHGAIAEVHETQGDLNQASFYAERALSLAPEGPEHLRLASRLRRTTGDLVGSLEALDTLVGVRPRESAAHVERARVLVALEQRGEARAAYALADDLAPLPTPVLGELLEVHIDLGELQEAVSLTERMLSAEPAAPVALTRGQILVQLGRTEEAIESMQLALTLDPANQEAREALAELAPEATPEPPALDPAAMAQEAEENLRDVGLRVRALAANLSARDFATAERLLEDGLLFFPGQQALAMLGAELRLHQLRLEEARDLLEGVGGGAALRDLLQALESGSEPAVQLPATGSLRTGADAEDRSPLEWLLRGDALERQGQDAAAVRSWRRALEGAPDSPLLLSRLQ
ncbi:MAG: tetratricopeptide repeat protein [Rhodothermales bacterium]|nr:tetratricopeptide repeat protein [Rhodothermales bacterium]MBO6780255.1 tetratricopeptide repeat protein [Rhodothermales bacterium]